MDNLTATSKLCTAICSAFYPDNRAVEMALFNAEIDANATATAKDKNIFKVAVMLVYGFVESSRSEGGTSVSVDRDAVEESIKMWAKQYDVAVEEVIDVRVVEDGSSLW